MYEVCMYVYRHASIYMYICIYVINSVYVLRNGVQEYRSLIDAQGYSCVLYTLVSISVIHYMQF